MLQNVDCGLNTVGVVPLVLGKMVNFEESCELRERSFGLQDGSHRGAHIGVCGLQRLLRNFTVQCRQYVWKGNPFVLSAIGYCDWESVSGERMTHYVGLIVGHVA